MRGYACRASACMNFFSKMRQLSKWRWLAWWSTSLVSCALFLLLMAEYSAIHSNFMRRGVFGSFRHLVARFRLQPSIQTTDHADRDAVTTQSELNPDFVSVFSPLSSSLPSSIERASSSFIRSRHSSIPINILAGKSERGRETLPLPTSFRGRRRCEANFILVVPIALRPSN